MFPIIHHTLESLQKALIAESLQTGRCMPASVMCRTDSENQFTFDVLYNGVDVVCDVMVNLNTSNRNATLDTCAYEIKSIFEDCLKVTGIQTLVSQVLSCCFAFETKQSQRELPTA